MRRAAITHVIWDVDGTLLDTETVFTRVGQEIASRHGKTFTLELKERLMGKTALEACRITVQELGLPYTPEELVVVRGDMQDRSWPDVQAMPGARDLVTRLSEAGVPMAIATGGDTRSLGLKTSRHVEWISRIKAVVTGDSHPGRRGKPAPDLFLEAASAMGKTERLGSVLVFEDAANGILAAKAAGMSVVAVPDEYMLKRSPETFAMADQVLGSLTEFDPSFWGLDLH